jgi:hypothetical protein
MVVPQTYSQSYPQTYPSYSNYQYPQPTQMMQQQIPQVVQNQILMVWVQNEEEASKYPLSAGQSVFLMNQNDDYLYMKSVDQLGKTTFVKKRLVDETEHREKQIDLSCYIRKEELEPLIEDKIQKEVEKRVSEISFKPTKTRRKSNEVD